MPSTELLLAFFTAAAIFAFIPGPGILYAAAQAMAGGRSVGLMGIFGLALGGYMHVIAAAAGLSFVFHAVPPVYTAVKLFGAAYLVWLGIARIRTKAAGTEGTPVVARKTGKRAFVEGVTVEMLNPKTAIVLRRLSAAIHRSCGESAGVGSVHSPGEHRERDVRAGRHRSRAVGGQRSHARGPSQPLSARGPAGQRKHIGGVRFATGPSEGLNGRCHVHAFFPPHRQSPDVETLRKMEGHRATLRTARAAGDQGFQR
jgi:hypothetical protein